LKVLCGLHLSGVTVENHSREQVARDTKHPDFGTARLSVTRNDLHTFGVSFPGAARSVITILDTYNTVVGACKYGDRASKQRRDLTGLTDFLWVLPATEDHMVVKVRRGRTRMPIEEVSRVREMA